MSLTVSRVVPSRGLRERLPVALRRWLRDGRSIALFVAAAITEIGGAYLVWIGIKDHKGVVFVALGAMALTAYGVVAAFQPSHEFGRVLDRLWRLFIVGSLLWGIAFDGFRPDRFDVIGALICLVGVAVIMYVR